MKYDFTENKDVPMYTKYGYLCYNPEKGKRPWYSKPVYLFLLDLFLLGWIQRLFLISKTYNVRLKIRKLVIL